ncbi:MAG: ABC transporter ATP-binding protein [Gemmatimonadales bacterium]|nr:ABC transporter ATP-binding protein [Gemmatimonadales bacterium]
MIEYFVRPLDGVTQRFSFDELIAYRSNSGMKFRTRPPGTVIGPLGHGSLDLPLACSRARALATSPRVLLLDEPLTALDAKLREQLRIEIDRLLRELGVTAVYVTHDQSEAMALGDRIVVMEKGRIAQVGTPQDVYYRPASAFVAEFIGTMNRLAGQRDRGDLVVAGGRLPLGGLETDAVAFRPEDARLVEAAGAHLSGKVLSSFFLGDHTRLVIDAGTGSPLIVETTERRTWPSGETVHLRVDAGALMAQHGKPS